MALNINPNSGKGSTNQRALPPVPPVAPTPEPSSPGGNAPVAGQIGALAQIVAAAQRGTAASNQFAIPTFGSPGVSQAALPSPIAPQQPGIPSGVPSSLAGLFGSAGAQSAQPTGGLADYGLEPAPELQGAMGPGAETGAMTMEPEAPMPGMPVQPAPQGAAPITGATTISDLVARGLGVNQAPQAPAMAQPGMPAPRVPQLPPMPQLTAPTGPQILPQYAGADSRANFAPGGTPQLLPEAQARVDLANAPTFDSWANQLQQMGIAGNPAAATFGTGARQPQLPPMPQLPTPSGIPSGLAAPQAAPQASPYVNPQAIQGGVQAPAGPQAPRGGPGAAAPAQQVQAQAQPPVAPAPAAGPAPAPAVDPVVADLQRQIAELRARIPAAPAAPAPAPQQQPPAAQADPGRPYDPSRVEPQEVPESDPIEQPQEVPEETPELEPAFTGSPLTEAKPADPIVSNGSLSIGGKGYRNAKAIPASMLQKIGVSQAILSQFVEHAQVGVLRWFKPTIDNEADAAALAYEFLRNQAQENMVVILADKNGKPISVLRHTLGGMGATQYYSNIMAGVAAGTPGCRKVYVVHNHPSGTMKFSSADMMAAVAIQKLLEGVGVQFAGSLVVGDAQNDPGARGEGAYGPRYIFHPGDKDTAKFLNTYPGDEALSKPITLAEDTPGGDLTAGYPVALTERVFKIRGNALAPRIANGTDAVRAIVPLLARKPGIAFLDKGGRIMGVLPLSLAEMTALATVTNKRGTMGIAQSNTQRLPRTTSSTIDVESTAQDNSPLARILTVMERANADQIIISVGDSSNDSQEAVNANRNVRDMAVRYKIDVLDTINNQRNFGHHFGPMQDTLGGANTTPRLPTGERMGFREGGEEYDPAPIEGGEEQAAQDYPEVMANRKATQRADGGEDGGAGIEGIVRNGLQEGGVGETNPEDPNAGAEFARQEREAGARVNPPGITTPDTGLVNATPAEPIIKKPRAPRKKPAAPNPSVFPTKLDTTLPFGRLTGEQMAQFGLSDAMLDQFVEHSTTGHVMSGVEFVKSAEDAAHVVAGLRKRPQEQVILLITDKNGRPIQIAEHMLSQPASCGFNPGILIGTAASTPGAAGVWFIHNHPSGKPTLSPADISAGGNIQKLVEAANLKYQGTMAIAGTRFAQMTPSGRIESNMAIKAAPRKFKVPITERMFAFRVSQNAKQFSNPTDAMAEAERIFGPDQPGIILLDNSNRMVATIPLAADVLRAMKAKIPGTEQTGFNRYVAGIDRANPVNMMIYTAGLDDANARLVIQNISGVAGATKINVLDAFGAGGQNRSLDIRTYGSDFNEPAAEYDPEGGQPQGEPQTLRDVVDQAAKKKNDLEVGEGAPDAEGMAEVLKAEPIPSAADMARMTGRPVPNHDDGLLASQGFITKRASQDMATIMERINKRFPDGYPVDGWDDNGTYSRGKKKISNLRLRYESHGDPIGNYEAQDYVYIDAVFEDGTTREVAHLDLMRGYASTPEFPTLTTKVGMSHVDTYLQKLGLGSIMYVEGGERLRRMGQRFITGSVINPAAVATRVRAFPAGSTELLAIPGSSSMSQKEMADAALNIIKGGTAAYTKTTLDPNVALDPGAEYGKTPSSYEAGLIDNYKSMAEAGMDDRLKLLNDKQLADLAAAAASSSADLREQAGENPTDAQNDAINTAEMEAFDAWFESQDTGSLNDPAAAYDDGENTVIPGGAREAKLKQQPAQLPVTYLNIGHGPGRNGQGEFASPEERKAYYDNTYLYFIDKRGKVHITENLSDLSQVNGPWAKGRPESVTHGLVFLNAKFGGIGRDHNGFMEAIGMGRIENRDGKLVMSFTPGMERHRQGKPVLEDGNLADDLTEAIENLKVEATKHFKLRTPRSASVMTFGRTGTLIEEPAAGYESTENYEGLAFSEADVRRFMSMSPAERVAFRKTLPDNKNNVEFNIMLEFMRQSDFDNRPGAQERRARQEARRQQIVEKHRAQGHPYPELAADRELNPPPTGRDPEAELDPENQTTMDDPGAAYDDGENQAVPGGGRQAWLKRQAELRAKNELPGARRIQWWTDVGHKHGKKNREKTWLWAYDKQGKLQVINAEELRSKLMDEYDMIGANVTHLDWEEAFFPGLLAGAAHGRIDATEDVVRVSLAGRINDPTFREQVKQELAEYIGVEVDRVKGYDFTGDGMPELFNRTQGSDAEIEQLAKDLEGMDLDQVKAYFKKNPDKVLLLSKGGLPPHLDKIVKAMRDIGYNEAKAYLEAHPLGKLLMENGRLVLVRDRAEIPGISPLEASEGEFNAVVLGDNREATYFVGDAISKEEIDALIKHEIGVHMGIGKDTDLVNDLFAELSDLVEKGEAGDMDRIMAHQAMADAFAVVASNHPNFKRIMNKVGQGLYTSRTRYTEERLTNILKSEGFTDKQINQFMRVFREETLGYLMNVMARREANVNAPKDGLFAMIVRWIKATIIRMAYARSEGGERPLAGKAMRAIGYARLMALDLGMEKLSKLLEIRPGDVRAIAQGYVRAYAAGKEVGMPDTRTDTVEMDVQEAAKDANEARAQGRASDPVTDAATYSNESMPLFSKRDPGQDPIKPENQAGTPESVARHQGKKTGLLKSDSASDRTDPPIPPSALQVETGRQMLWDEQLSPRISKYGEMTEDPGVIPQSQIGVGPTRDSSLLVADESGNPIDLPRITSIQGLAGKLGDLAALLDLPVHITQGRQGTGMHGNFDWEKDTKKHKDVGQNSAGFGLEHVSWKHGWELDALASDTTWKQNDHLGAIRKIMADATHALVSMDNGQVDAINVYSKTTGMTVVLRVGGRNRKMLHVITVLKTGKPGADFRVDKAIQSFKDNGANDVTVIGDTQATSQATPQANEPGADYGQAEQTGEQQAAAEAETLEKLREVQGNGPAGPKLFNAIPPTPPPPSPTTPTSPAPAPLNPPATADDMARRVGDVLRGRYFDGISTKAHQNAERTGSAAVRAVSDIIHTRPGTENPSSDRDLPKAIMSARIKYQNKFNQIMRPLRDQLSRMTSEQREQFYRELVDQITGRTNIQPGVAGHAATQLIDLLKELHDYRTAAGENMGQVQQYFPAVYNSELITANRTAFIADATRAYEIELSQDPNLTPQEIQAKAAAAAAALYRTHTRGMGDAEWASIFTSGRDSATENSSKERVFGRQAQGIMAKWQTPDPFYVISRYIGSAVKRAELVRRFGPEGEKWEAMANAMEADGVPIETINEMGQLVKLAAGLGVTPLDNSERMFMDTVNLYTAAAAMGKSAMNNLFEPSAMGIRGSTVGNPFRTVNAYAETWARFIRNLVQMLPVLGDHVGPTFWQEYGEHIGSIHNSLDDAWMSMHAMEHGMEEANPAMRWITNRVYQANLMESTENAKLQASHALGHAYILDHAGMLDGSHYIPRLFKFDTRSTAEEALLELGIPKSKQIAFAAWCATLKQTKDRAARMAMLTDGSEMARLYEEAQIRFSHQSAVRANRAHKPVFQDAVLGRLALQLMSFSYSYFSEVTDRMYRMAKRAITTNNMPAIQRINMMLPLMLSPLTVVAMGALFESKDYLFPTESSEKRKKDHWIYKLFNASSFAGMFGPKLEMATKYIARDQPPGGVAGQTAVGVGRVGKKAIELAMDDTKTQAEKEAALKKAAARAAVAPIKGAAVIAGSAMHPAVGAVAVAATNDTGWSNELQDVDTPKKGTPPKPEGLPKYRR